jgi:protease PrsW
VDIRTEAAIAALIPSSFWLVLVYSRDRYEREPKRLILKLFVMSILAVAVAFILESATKVNLTGSDTAIIISAIGVGLIEEGSIFVTMVLGVRRNPNLNEPVDGIVYASTVALGFAAIETTLYILRAYDTALGSHLTPSRAATLALVTIAPIRAITGNLGHMAWAGIVGYAYARHRLGTARRSTVFGAYLVAAILHAAYDGLLSLNAQVLAYTVLIFSVAVYMRLFHHALSESPFRRHQLRPTPAPPPVFVPATGPPLHVPKASVVPVVTPSRPPPPPFMPTNIAPANGLDVWAQPNPASHLVARLEKGTAVRILQHLGAWAHVLVAAGWSGWVDGRALLPLPTPPPSAADPSTHR